MPEPFLAEIKMISFNFPPRGWALCNGQFLPINQNQALFALLGTTYGGNGQTTFALPDLRGRTPVHFGSGINQGQVGGEQNHTLTLAELAAHSHIAQANSGPPGAGPVNGVWASQAGYSSAAPNNVLHPSSISPVGGSQAHTNMQPYLVINFVIALQGIFPSQN